MRGIEGDESGGARILSRLRRQYDGGGGGEPRMGGVAERRLRMRF